MLCSHFSYSLPRKILLNSIYSHKIQIIAKAAHISTMPLKGSLQKKILPSELSF